MKNLNYLFVPNAYSRRVFVAIFAIAAALFMPSVALAEKVNTTWFGNKAIEGYDPVAYFTESKPVEGSKDHVYEWHGANWHFSSAENLEKFKAEPEKYAPQYGGFCAYAVAKNSTAGIDPDQWTIVDGKLYLNYNAKIQKKWSQDRDDFIVKADKNWPEINR